MTVDSQVIMFEGKKVKLFHQMQSEGGDILATCVQLMLHVNLTTRKSCPPLPEVQHRMEALVIVDKEGI